jgi:hypothetical protein
MVDIFAEVLIIYLISRGFRSFSIGEGGTKSQHVGMVLFIGSMNLFGKIRTKDYDIDQISLISIIVSIVSIAIVASYVYFRFSYKESLNRRKIKDVIIRTIFLIIGIITTFGLTISILQALGVFG